MTATALAKQAAPPREQTIAYKPLGSKIEVELSIGRVRQYLCVPTRQGVQPSDADVVKFMMLCKARELDPWVGDAFLIGYDSQDGAKFSLITAHQALLKRAEINPEYDGLESGVIVKLQDQMLVDYRPGDLVLDGEVLVGGWAKCHRKDRKKPAYDAIKLSTYDTGRSRWKADPAGMIVKVAEASVLRASFPTQIGGLFTKDELEHMGQERIADRGTMPEERAQKALGELEAFTDKITAGNGKDAAGTQPAAKEASHEGPQPEASTAPAPAAASAGGSVMSETFWADYNTALADAMTVDDVAAVRDFHEGKCSTEADKEKARTWADNRFAALPKAKPRQKSLTGGQDG